MFAARVSIIGWIVIVVISLTAGIITDSVTLLLDASQGLVALIVAVLVKVALQKINRPPDDDYHFGYGKYEPFIITLQGVMIIVTCVISIKFAIQDIIHPDDIDYYNVAISGALLAGIIALFIAVYIRFVASRTHSGVLKISSMGWFADSALSFGILAGFLLGAVLNHLGYTKYPPYVDPIMAILLALSLIVTPVKTVMSNILDLLDAAPAMHIRENIKKTIEECRPHHLCIDKIRMRSVGKKIFMELCFLADENLTVKEIHRSISDFEKELTGKIPYCDMVVHYKSRSF